MRGQSEVAITAGRVVSSRSIRPTRPRGQEAVEAIGQAEAIVMGPGSWYTCVLPRLLVPEHARAAWPRRATRILVLNLVAQPGRPAASAARVTCDVLGEHVPRRAVDVVLADRSTCPTSTCWLGRRPSSAARLHLAPVGVPGRPLHDPTRLAVAFQEIFAGSGPPSDGRRSVRPGFHEEQAVIDMAAMTAGVKDELSRLPVTKTCCRKAEMSALLRFAGGLHIVSGRIVVEAELDTGAAARRMRADISDMFGHPSTFTVVAPAGCGARQPLHRAGRTGR